MIAEDRLESMPRLNAATAASLNLKLRDPASVIVYLYLHSQCPRGKLKVSASLQRIADGTGLSKSTVQRSVAYLEKAKAVRISKATQTSEPVYELRAGT